MSNVYRLGNSLAAVIPSLAARQLSLKVGTPLVVHIYEDEIRIRNANTPSAKSKQSGKGNPSKLVVPAEEPW